MSSTDNKYLTVGLDFDNTIVRYDHLFYEVAVEMSLVPSSLERTKTAVRAHLRAEGKEDSWTRLQGEIYGPQMSRAQIFPGVVDFFRFCGSMDTRVRIVSHRTRRPYLGPPHDLHDSARKWIASSELNDAAGCDLLEEWVFFEETRRDKAMRIQSVQCDIFLDDLLDFLMEPEFPTSTQGVLFDPGASETEELTVPRVSSWEEFTGLVRKGISA